MFKGGKPWCNCCANTRPAAQVPPSRTHARGVCVALNPNCSRSLGANSSRNATIAVLRQSGQGVQSSLSATLSIALCAGQTCPRSVKSTSADMTDFFQKIHLAMTVPLDKRCLILCHSTATACSSWMCVLQQQKTFTEIDYSFRCFRGFLLLMHFVGCPDEGTLKFKVLTDRKSVV